jgi:hypothetical protein
MTRNLLRSLCIMSLALAPTLALAQTPLTRVQGTLESLKDSVVTVKTRTGDLVAVRLTPNFIVSDVTPATLADIKPGLFVGSGAMAAPDGTLMATEVHIFAESQRGTGEGSRPWDLGPSSSMTNANVTASVDGVNGRVLTMTYQGGEKHIVVSPETPIVAYAPGSPSDLTKDAAVSLRAEKLADGSFQASRVIVGRGVVPPM